MSADPEPEPGPTLHDLFARSAARHPDAVALEVRDIAYTYRQLDEYSRRLADRILLAGGRRPERIALLASRSLPAFAGYLAALRLGATVVPLNPAHPEVRNRALCALARAQVIVADDTAVLRWEGSRRAGQGTLLALTDAAVVRPPAGPPPVSVPDGSVPDGSVPDGPGRRSAAPDDVALIQFVPGPTGRPMGIPVRHRHVTRQIADYVDRLEVAPGARVSHTFDLSSEAAVYELFVAWAAGATLVVPQRAELLAPIDHLLIGGISHLFADPALIASGTALDKLPLGLASGLRHSVFLGERLTYRQAELWRAVAPRTIIENAYGPAELMAVGATYRVPAERDRWPETSNGTLPLGRLRDGTEHVVLGEDAREATEGELCVRGPGQFEGYLNPADDIRRFLRWNGRTYYRTGDRVRREGDALVLLGRVDDRLRLRGQRVEPGEIEALLRRHALVTDAAVILARGKGAEPESVACYTGAPFDHAAMRTWLRKRIPACMVPRRFVRCEELPVRADGQVDRAALLRGYIRT